MKNLSIFPKYILATLILVSCSEKIDFYVPDVTIEPPPKPQPKISIGLSNTEAKLVGKWYLRSMSDGDVTYNDSLVNRARNIQFNNTTYVGEQFPTCNDNCGLAVGLTPEQAIPDLLGREVYYSAPDSIKLRIIYHYGFYPHRDTSDFTIVALSDESLKLVDPVQKKHWTFYK